MSRERWLIFYCAVVGTLGWVWLLLSGPAGVDWQTFGLFLIVALLIESAGFRVPPADPHSLVGITLVTAALTLGPANGALVAAVSGLIFGVLLPIIYQRPSSLYTSVARPYLRSGVRAIAILSGNALASVLAGGAPDRTLLLVTLIVCYPLIIQFNRVTREYLQGGRTGVITWWRSSWRLALSAEVLPLPVAWLGVAIYERLELGYFLMACAALLATSMTVRWAGLSLQQQRRSVRELALLNQVSRSIIRAELSVEALCELIYNQASKLVDTSSFHLGLFEPGSDRYTLLVRVQDRVRLPRLQVDLPFGDGIIGWIRETGQGVLVEDFLEEMDRLPARPRYQSHRPPRSGIYIPLQAGDTVIGTISIQSYRPRAFDADDMRLLSLIADQAAVAISKARAFNQARERALQLQAIREVSEQITAILDLDTLLASVVRLIRERFGYHPVHIFTLEGDELVFRASTADGAVRAQLRERALRLGDGIVGAAAAESRTMLVNDVLKDERYISDAAGTRSELAVPLRFGDQNLGVLDLQSVEVDRFTDSDRFVMETLASQIAIAIESARAFTSQREEAWTLNALLQVAANIASASTLSDLLATIVRLPPLLLGCDRCYCLVWDAENAIFKPLAAYGLSPEQRARFVGKPIHESQAPLLIDLRQKGAPIVVSDAQSNTALFPALLESYGGGTLLALPLMSRKALLGVLIADYNNPQQELPQRAMTIHMGIANQAQGALERALLEQEALEAERLEEEVRVARGIQTALLPAEPPNITGWDIAATWRSARLVGGDFYDFWRLPQRKALTVGESISSAPPPIGSPFSRPGATPDHPDDQLVLGFVIADVSDKGVPAAMFMALSRSLIRAASLDGSAPNTALMRANRWITRDSESAMFVTVFYGVLDTATGELHFACAGHNPPLLLCTADGSVQPLTTPGIALGVLEEATIGEARVLLHAGDVLVCYTDGVTEAANARDEAFGVERLTEVILANRSHSADTILHAITDALLAFTEERALLDDVTLVVIKCDATQRAML